MHLRVLAWPLVLVVALVALAGAPGLLGPALAGSANGAAPSAPIRLYLSGPTQYSESGTLSPLDPQTLLDLPGARPLQPVPAGTPVFWAVSGDGTTLVSFEYPPAGDPAASAPTAADLWLVVRDARTGAERARFHPPSTEAGSPWLNRDGSRLILADGQGTWQVLATADGRLLATVHGSGWNVGPWGAPVAAIDPAGQRLYHLVAGKPVGPMDSPPWPTLVVAYDLASGREVGRLDLPTLPAWFQAGPAVKGVPTLEQLSPALAVAPDGRTLAIVAADRDRLLLIDAAHLSVVQDLALIRPTGLLDRLLGWLPLAPQRAEAKGINGTVRLAVFGPDGRRLYLFGYVGSVDKDGNERVQGSGLTAIDPATGRIVAGALPGAWIDQLLPTSDGRSLYVLGPKHDPGEVDYALRRLDAASLEELASRTLFRGGRTLLVCTGG